VARQLVLDLPVTPAYGLEDFLPGESNARALALVQAWPEWPDRLLRIEGPTGSGKSHLAAIWADRADAAIIPAYSVTAERVLALAAIPALVLEDLDRGVGGGQGDERALFHLVNLARERGRHILLTSAMPPECCGLSTPDLVSRLRLAPSVTLSAPDDALLRAVLVKLFHDRQIAVEASVIEFVASRMERSLGAAQAIVAALDREALSRGRRVTRPIAANILAGYETDGSDNT
jgi:chromosomal replication initiation ATPase DnaA